MHPNLVWVLDMQSYLCNMLPRSSHYLNISYMLCFFITNIIWFDARPNAIHTFGLCIKQFLIASNIDFQTFKKHLHILHYHLGVSNHQDSAGSGASKERLHRKEENVLFNDSLNIFYLQLYGVGKIAQIQLFISNCSWKFETDTVITFLFVQMGVLWLALQSFLQTTISMRLSIQHPYLLLTFLKSLKPWNKSKIQLHPNI